jgi:hypothetical protein
MKYQKYYWNNLYQNRIISFYKELLPNADNMAELTYDSLTNKNYDSNLNKKGEFLRRLQNEIGQIIRDSFNDKIILTIAERDELLISFIYVEDEIFTILPDPLCSEIRNKWSKTSLEEIFVGGQVSYDLIMNLLVEQNFCYKIDDKRYFAYEDNTTKLAALSFVLTDLGHINRSENQLLIGRLFCRNFGVVYTDARSKIFKRIETSKIYTEKHIGYFSFIPSK